MNSNQETPRYLLESLPMDVSTTDVENLIGKYDFYSISRNPLGKGIHTSSVNAFALYHNKEIVYDRLTGLCWQRGGSARELSWKEADDYWFELRKSEYGGIRCWALPNLAEALSLLEPSKQNYNHMHPHLVPLHTHPIFDTTQRWIWVGDWTNRHKETWYVQFAQGDFDFIGLDSTCFVRAVARHTLSEDQLEEISQEDIEGSTRSSTNAIFDFSAGKCDFCKGTGKQPCQRCGSSGSITQSYPSAYQTITMTMPCPNCGGRGLVSCSRCHGSWKA